MFENVWNPATSHEFMQQLQDHVQQSGQPVTAYGGQTALDYLGQVSEQAIGVNTTSWTTVIDYPARDMTITVQSGIRIAELQKILAGENQRLPIDIPQAEQATLGGAIACNVAGPSQYGYGTFRDYLIGMSAVDGTGRKFSAGGRVVKNVAGYDLCKLMIGSIGTLGVLTQVTLKTRPICESQAFVCAGFDNFEALAKVFRALNLSETRPVILDVLSGTTDTLQGFVSAYGRQGLNLPVFPQVLCCGFEGTESEVAWQCDRVQQELSEHQPVEMGVLTGDLAATLKHGLTAHSTQVSNLTFRITSTPSQALAARNLLIDKCESIQLHAGNGILIGRVGDAVSTVQEANEFIASARNTGCEFVVTQVRDDWKADIDRLGPVPSTWPLMQGLRDTLDPHHVLNPNHLWPRPTKTESV